MFAMERWLAENGYRIAFRRDGWVECLAIREDERWVGRGDDDAGAIADLVAAMFPSHAARVALETQLRARQPIEAPKPVVAPVTPVELAMKVVAPVAEPTPIVVAPPPPAPPKEQAKEQAKEPPRETRREEREEPDRASIDEALAALGQLGAEIEEARDDVGKMAPERQRLYLLGWICRARAWEEAADGEQAVIATVARIAKRLSDFAKSWWPGNVRPLQLTARPEDVLPSATVAHTWSEAAARVDERLDQLLHDAVAQGLDEYGYKDGERCVPPPPDPTSALERARTEIDETIAAGGGFFPKTPPNLSPQQVRELEEQARMLRWLRRVADEEPWSTTMGRFRWLAWSIGTRGNTLSDLLDPLFAPPVPWSRVVRGIEDDKEKRVKAATVATRAPGADASTADISAWILEAIEVLDNPTMAALLQAIKSPAQNALDELRATADRRIRRRVVDLGKRLVTMTEGEARQVRSAVELATPIVEVAVAAPISVEDPAERLRRIVRSRVEGQRAVFVTNRPSPDIEERLHELLGIDVSTFEASPRRVDALCERIANRKYDIVLSATGFQHHTVDSAISKVAKSVQIPLIRVDRGRPLACVKAIARELGLASQSSG
jgi:hypothetical protein